MRFQTKGGNSILLVFIIIQNETQVIFKMRNKRFLAGFSCAMEVFVAFWASFQRAKMPPIHKKTMKKLATKSKGRLFKQSLDEV